KRGFALVPRRAREVAVLARPVEERYAAVLAFLADGESWSSSALALALGASQRSVQRALDSLAAAKKIQSFGRGRARRWMTPPVPGVATTCVLPAPLPVALTGPHDTTSRRDHPGIWALCGHRPRQRGDVRRPPCLVRLRRQSECARSGERRGGALDRGCRACRQRLRRPASVSDRRGPHPEDR